MKKVYICMDENRFIFGVFTSKTEASKWCSEINNIPQYDSIVKAYVYYIAKQGWTKTQHAAQLYETIKKGLDQ
jgi:hypothetical protein